MEDEFVESSIIKLRQKGFIIPLTLVVEWLWTRIRRLWK